MGRGTTWSRQVPWLTRFGSVFTYDAPWHRGRDVEDSEPVSTERFVADLGDAVASLGAPAVLIGHSMGGLHSWCLAAQRPELVRALVVEDMAPDFVGRTTGAWEPWVHALPVEYSTAEQVFSTSSGPSRGAISWRRSTGPRPAGDCTAGPPAGLRSRGGSGAFGTTGSSGSRSARRCC